MVETIAMIAAVAENGAIGKDNKMPWHIPADLQYFKQNTLEKPCIMGRKTYESIIDFLGKPLPERDNIVISRSHPDSLPQRVFFTDCPENALEKAFGHKEVMVIGGAQIYDLFLPFTNRLYLTEIEASFTADAFFPEFDKSEWKQTVIHREEPRDGLPAYSFIRYDKK